MPNENKNAQGAPRDNNQKTGQKQGQDRNTDPNRGSNQPDQPDHPHENQRRSGYDLDVDTDVPGRKNAPEADPARRDPSRQGQGHGQGQDDSRSSKKRP